MCTKTEHLKKLIDRVMQTDNLITVLTGAGVSAESGIPTFRGPEGYWTVGSQHYQPSEIATFHMLNENPKEVWKWFLYRRGVCASAQPNPGHLAIADMEARLGERFQLITQNVDGLHLKAGNTLAKTFQVHGNLNYMRCIEECADSLTLIPSNISLSSRTEDLSKSDWDQLVCPQCGAITRPHVLLWDESYDEQYYRYYSAIGAAKKTKLLIVVGTTGSANLPNQIVHTAGESGATIIDINIDFNQFSRAAEKSVGGVFLKGSSATYLPELAKLIFGESTLGELNQPI